MKMTKTELVGGFFVCGMMGKFGCERDIITYRVVSFCWL